METSIYDQELIMMKEEWALFGGQFMLTTPEDLACPADLGVHVLQGDCQLGGQSPVDEFLQDSIWTDKPNVMLSEHLSSPLFQKENRPFEEKFFNRFSSSDEAFLLYSDADTDNNPLIYQPNTLDSSLEPYSSLSSTSEIVNPFEHQAESVWNLNDESSSSPCFTNIMHQNLIPLEDGIDGTLISEYKFQQVPQDHSSDLDGFDLDDPVSVCKILKLLGDDIKWIPSPVSPEEVDSVFEDSSPKSEALQFCTEETRLSSSDEESSDVPLHYNQHELTTKIRKFTEQKVDRREKKKEQNKTAAQRYRIKKREEKGVVKTEVEVLEEKNATLKSRADDLTREINYLKALLEEIKKQ